MSKKKGSPKQPEEFLYTDDDLERGPHHMGARHNIKFYRQRAEDSKNLVYVWLAIYRAHMAGLEMPDWCYQQIAYWAGEIYELSHGLDPVKGRAIVWPSDEDEKAETVNDRWDSAWRGGKTGEVSEGEALKKAKELLFPPERGKNPFRSIRVDMQGELSHFKMLAREYAPDDIKERLLPSEDRNERKRRARIKPQNEKPEPK